MNNAQDWQHCSDAQSTKYPMYVLISWRTICFPTAQLRSRVLLTADILVVLPTAWWRLLAGRLLLISQKIGNKLHIDGRPEVRIAKAWHFDEHVLTHILQSLDYQHQLTKSTVNFFIPTTLLHYLAARSAGPSLGDFNLLGVCSTLLTYRCRARYARHCAPPPAPVVRVTALVNQVACVVSSLVVDRFSQPSAPWQRNQVSYSE